MKKVFLNPALGLIAVASFFLILSMVSCADVLDPVGPTAGNNHYGSSALTVSLESVSKTSIDINAIPVIYASISLTDPAGGIQTAEWTPGSSVNFIFHSDYTGDHTLNFLDVDSNSYTNTASAVITMMPGYNYYVTVRLGGSVIVILKGAGTPIVNTGNTVGSIWLATNMDRYHRQFTIYDDASSAANNFNQRGYFGTGSALMKEDVTNNPHSGLTCIQATVFGNVTPFWSGCYFQNGVLIGNSRNPIANWGTEPNAGVDLRGATTLTFWARGETGTEQVNFFAFGIGRDTNTGLPIVAYPDASPRVGTGAVTLTTEWKKYTIDVSHADLSYVLGGFGWTAATSPAGVVFYLDDISYDLPRLNAPRFSVSFTTINSTNSFDLVSRNVAYVYDNALALMAFLTCGENDRARLIADALVYAQDHDRYFTDGRLRNGYQAGELTLPAGWEPNGKKSTVRMPGFWDSYHQNWFEDEYTVSTATGNIAWAMLALLAYYQTCGGQAYLNSVIRMAHWVVNETLDNRGNGGFIGGKLGWEPDQTDITYKSTEHNLDLYAAFSMLYQLTGDNQWKASADSARNFAMSMWYPAFQCFLIGTFADGININTNVVPTDCQAWMLLSMRDLPSVYNAALTFAENVNQMPGTWGFGFTYNQTGIWYEGTAQMATAYAFTGQTAKYNLVMNQLLGGRAPSGAMYATDTTAVFTALANIDESPWYYFRREHVGATAWQILAEKKINPFWLGTSYGQIQ